MSMDSPASLGSLVSHANLIGLDAGKGSVYAEDSRDAAVAAYCKELGHRLPIIYDRNETIFVSREDYFDRTPRYDLWNRGASQWVWLL
jgi:hypothetical protein